MLAALSPVPVYVRAHQMLTTGDDAAAVLMRHYYNDDLPAPPAATGLTLHGVAAEKALLHYRIDQEHSNSCAVRQALGSLQRVTPTQRATLAQAGQLALLTSPRWVSAKNGAGVLPFSLPRQGVSLLRLSW